MLRMVAILFGIGFIFAGVAGFLPSFLPNGLLFGYFSVDMMHNVFHLATGVIAIMCALSHRASKMFFIVFGIIYGVIAVAGFMNMPMAGMQMNLADNILHIVIAAVSLYLGFSARSQRA
jgi:hypothetical protein